MRPCDSPFSIENSAERVKSDLANDDIQQLEYAAHGSILCAWALLIRVPESCNAKGHLSANNIAERPSTARKNKFLRESVL